MSNGTRIYSADEWNTNKRQIETNELSRINGTAFWSVRIQFNNGKVAFSRCRFHEMQECVMGITAEVCETVKEITVR